MSLFQSLSVDEIRQRGTIKDTDVQALRRALREDGQVSELEADTLLMLNSACRIKDASWTELFVEAVTDHLVNQAAPEGYVTAANADWLFTRIAHDGRIRSHAEMELVCNVLDKARWAPQCLSRFALDQVRDAVVTGTGPLRTGQPVAPGTIRDGEVDLARRILYSFGGDGHIAVTKAEAETLFAINAALLDATANTAWSVLFVKAIANAVMASSGYAVPTREEALRSERTIADARSGSELVRDAFVPGKSGDSARARIGGFVGAVATGVTSVWRTYRPQSAEERALARLERQRIEIITNDEITESEIGWLAEHIRANGRIGANERALLAFIKHESPSVPAALQALVSEAEKAA